MFTACEKLLVKPLCITRWPVSLYQIYNISVSIKSLMRGDLLTKSADDRNLTWKILVFGKKVAYGR